MARRDCSDAMRCIADDTSSAVLRLARGAAGRVVLLSPAIAIARATGEPPSSGSDAPGMLGAGGISTRGMVLGLVSGYATDGIGYPAGIVRAASACLEAASSRGLFRAAIIAAALCAGAAGRLALGRGVAAGAAERRVVRESAISLGRCSPAASIICRGDSRAVNADVSARAGAAADGAAVSESRGAMAGAAGAAEAAGLPAGAIVYCERMRSLLYPLASSWAASVAVMVGFSCADRKSVV